MPFYEVISTEEGSPIKALVHQVKKFEMHWHHSIEILMILKGSIHLRIGEKFFLLEENDVILINSKEVHNTSSTHEENMILAFQVHPDYYSYYYPLFRRMRFICNSAYSKGEEEKFNIIRHILAQIIWELNKKVEGYKFIVGSQLNSLGQHLMNNFEHSLIEDEKDLVSEEDIERLERILDYIKANIGNKITLTDIAEKEHMNSYYLSHYFKGKVGLSFQEYINYLRIEKAHNLLVTSRDTVTKVALQCGFSSTNYFNKLFKELYNCTPTEYRQKHSYLKGSEKVLEVTKTKSKTYLDVDRRAVFQKLLTYIKPASNDKEDYEIYSIKRNISIDISKRSRISYEPYWNTLMTFGRAAEGLRADVQRQLRQIQRDIQFRYVRFHGIFADEMMVYNVKEEDEVIYNWTYVDELFDFFMEIGIKPFVELAFMPSELRSSDAETLSWWKANISPPKDIALWTDLVKALIRHCIHRYGFEEVSTWYFEVWNEPELYNVFWAASKEEYLEFYKETTLAIQSISKKLRIGGPSITHGTIINSTWLDDFLSYCNKHGIIVDFISIHIYPEYISQDTLGELEVASGNDLNNIDLSKMDTSKIDVSKIDLLKIKKIYHNDDHTAKIINEVHNKMEAILDYKPELHITEWNASSLFGNLIHDTAYTASFIIKNVLESIGKADSLGYWTCTDIFEEMKLGISHFHGGFGLINKDGLKKASYYAYYLLNKLGSKIIEQGKDYIITSDGDNIQILAYNYVYFDELFLSGDTSALTHKERYDIYQEKPLKEFAFIFKGLSGQYKITRYSLNRESGSVFDQWLKIGAPENMTKEEIAYLDGVSKPGIDIEDINIEKEYYTKLEIPVHGAQLISLEKRI